MNNKHIMIYGAYGYTGELIAREAVARGYHPVLAGRNAQKLQLLADELNLPAVVIPLDAQETLEQSLLNIDLVIHCAGPFSATAEPMMRACINAQTHYQDITGEIAVFEAAYSLGDRARTAGIVLCPGTGFDVIPTDCLAAALHAAMPSATHLVLGFDSDSSLSPGTAKTAIEGLGIGSAVRRNGRIQVTRHGQVTRQIDFGRGAKFSVAIPWGDIATAFHSTGIGNIEVYIPMPPGRARKLQYLNTFRWLLRNNRVQNWLKAKVNKSLRGPSDTYRAKHKTWVWGEVRNDRRGERRVGRLVTANGYDVTVSGALAVMEFLVDYAGDGGYFTPSALCGAGLVEKLPGSSALDITSG
ncbi:saccharopine dehydrogenase family protein [Microbulbifer spongiae]|uniref:Saccharopine dehydrogenase NADP-binding domain-containing protein n=1 Tax=Microbulbifer spongiae TaxID=2944933 RepID=A0ABY9EDB0_9GAMM|nr:saccharopine dehydrogenase NADP-binding domain-containing protein [Microbulbifer sp. MI-G]WKD51013.1 saccharopine dehydrogenase NADP-binding domain-containing protein [Microbulbifer sp. MI-G]